MLKAFISRLWMPTGNDETDQNYVSGTKLIHAGKFTEAEPLLEKAAANGSASAMHNLALVYKNGMGSRFDLDEAVRLFTQANSHGHKRAGSELEILEVHRANPNQAVADINTLAQNFNRSGGDGTFINAAAEIVLAGLEQSGRWPDEVIAWVYGELRRIQAQDSSTHEALVEHLEIPENESLSGLPLYDLVSATTARRVSAQLDNLMKVLAEDGHDQRILLFTRCSIVGRVCQRAKLYSNVHLWGVARFLG